MATKTLSIHAGAGLATLEEIEAAPTPAPTPSWHPIPHINLIREVQTSFTRFGLTVTNEQHALYHGESGCDRYFGVFDIAPQRLDGTTIIEGADDYSIAVGLRNSHDKTFPAALVMGSRVFVCDNLAFSGEVKIARTHTTWIERDLPGLVYRASARMVDAMGLQAKRIDAYKDHMLPDLSAAHHIMVVAVQKGIIPGRLLDDVANEWDAPRHEEFIVPTYWSLFNAFTEVLKETSATELPRRTQMLHGMFDQAVGLLAAPSAN